MTGRASFRLNGQALNLESAGQTKIKIAKSLTSLGICGVPSQEGEKKVNFSGFGGEFCGVWLICRSAGFCHPDHSVNLKIDAFSLRTGTERVAQRISP
jgi:hypothetical protein